MVVTGTSSGLLETVATEQVLCKCTPFCRIYYCPWSEKKEFASIDALIQRGKQAYQEKDVDLAVFMWSAALVKLGAKTEINLNSGNNKPGLDWATAMMKRSKVLSVSRQPFIAFHQHHSGNACIPAVNSKLNISWYHSFGTYKHSPTC